MQVAEGTSLNEGKGRGGECARDGLIASVPYKITATNNNAEEHSALSTQRDLARLGNGSDKYHNDLKCSSPHYQYSKLWASAVKGLSVFTESPVSQPTKTRRPCTILQASMSRSLIGRD